MGISNKNARTGQGKADAGAVFVLPQAPAAASAALAILRAKRSGRPVGLADCEQSGSGRHNSVGD